LPPFKKVFSEKSGVMPKKTLPVTFLIVCFFLCHLLRSAAQPQKPYQKSADGILIYPDKSVSGNTAVVRLQVLTDKIIRVTASPTTTIADRKSLITVNHELSAKWTVTKVGEKVIVKTAALTATVLQSTGAVSFADKNGTPIVKERQFNGRMFHPAVFTGEPSFGITQTFETLPDDAYYGLGQHQDDQFNYKGRQVFMFQNNTEVAVPFLISKNNYGILWDNYSLSKVGDVREYMPLSSLKLYSKEGDLGWLTASYSNDRKKPAEIAFTKAESDINYRYLDDTKNFLSKDFNIQNGQVTWEGSIASDFTGVHKISFLYAGYTKVWIDGKLLLDRWRQAWNPGQGLIVQPMEKGRKYAVRIEWVPDGGESYLSVKWLNPVPVKDINAFSFASEAGKELDYYFVWGNNMDEVISGYRSITGKATIVPKWAMGFWQSRERYKTQDEILNTVDEFRKRKVPLDNIVLDWSYWRQPEWGS